MQKIFFSIATVSALALTASAMPNPAPAFACSTSNCTLNGNNNYVSANAGGNSIAAGFGGNASAPLFMTQASAGGNSVTPGLVPAGTTISYLNTYPNGVQAQVLTGTTNVYVTIISRSGQYEKNGDSSKEPQLDFKENQQPKGNGAFYDIYLSEAIVEFVKGLGSTDLWKATKTYYQGSSTKSYPSTLNFGKAVYVTDTSSDLPDDWFCKKGSSTCATVDPGFYANTTSLDDKENAGSFRSKADFTTWTTSLLETKVFPWDQNGSGVYVFVIQPGAFYKQDPNTPVVYPSEGLNTYVCSVHDAAWITPFGQGGILTYAIIGAPNTNGDRSLCKDRIQALTGLDGNNRGEAIMRLSVLNDIAHELLEIVTNPIPFQSWAVTVDNIPYEAGDLCRNVFLSKSSAAVKANSKTSYFWNVELSNGHKYLVQGMWNAATQSCVGA